MPLYDFKCRKCGKKFEELVRLGDTPVCPKCGAADTERLFSVTAGISTSTTRDRSTRVGRRKAQGIKREKDHADALYRKNYLKEHS
ncbi:MAG TPA: zinc ribbon domain-containing protein [Gammaproteobacteria bacterium]|jgi:putative FmdB family regulatory protein|nr:zinc ribbon domain-containing protein [Gammaproteobacteria bacterium]